MQRRRVIAAALAVMLLTSVLGAAGAVAGQRTSATLQVKQQTGFLEATWSYRGTAPRSQKLTLLAGASKVKTLSPSPRVRSVRIASVRPGRYTLQLSGSNPSVTSRRGVVVYGAPAAVTGLRAQAVNGEALITWSLPEAGEFDLPKNLTVSVTVDGTTTAVALPADAMQHRVTGLDSAKDYEIRVAASNTAGSSPFVAVTLRGDGGVDALTSSRLITLADAEKVFGSFAMVNRSPLGPVDLAEPAQAALNPVLSALQRCMLTSTSATAVQDGLTNVGGVWATRNAAGTQILTSGALALDARDATDWLAAHRSLEACVRPALREQLDFVARQLSPNAKVADAVYSPIVVVPNHAGTQLLRIDAKVFPNGGVAGEPSQDLQLVWVVVARGATLGQYILIRQGDPIADATVDSLLEAASARNSG
jgi:hypothetical protein